MKTTNTHFIRLLLLAISIITNTPGRCQVVNDPPLTFEPVGDYRKIQGAIVALFKDSKGFMWFLLDGGIGRFDGYEYKVFRSDAADTATIGGGLPLAIAEDHNGIIWISCDLPRGLNSYNPASGKFTRYGSHPSIRDKLPSVQILSLVVDQSNTLYMCTAGEGIYSLDSKTNLIRHFTHDDHNVASISDNHILGGVALPDHGVLFYTAKQIDLLDTKTLHFSRYKTKFESTLSLSQWKPGILLDFSGNVCIPSNKGLNIIGSNQDTFVHFPDPLQNIFEQNNRKYILIPPDNKTWINCDSGLFVLDLIKNNYSVYKHDYYNSESIPRSLHQELTYDPSGVIWIKGGGMCKLSLENDKFHIVNNPQEQVRLGGPVYANVRRTFRDRTGNILQPGPRGIYQFDFESKTFITFPPDKNAREYLNKKDIRFVFQDLSGSYWFGIDNTKIAVFNPLTLEWKSWIFDEQEYYSYPGDYNTQSILEDDEGHIWFVGEFSVNQYDQCSNTFKSYMVDSMNRNNRINSFEVILSTEDGQIWFGGMGMFKYNSANDRIHPVIFEKNEAARILSDSRILSFLKADSMCYWIGTDGNGMFLLDLSTGNCRRISVTDGLPNNRIFAISRDFKGSLWVSTDQGLCRYDPENNLFDGQDPGSFKTYDANYTWPVQGYQGPANTMYFKMFAHPGLLYFNPDSIPSNTFIPPVYITDFRLFNKSVFVNDSTGILDSTIEVKRNIVLRHDQNAILFTFAALSFIRPEHNQYAYMLDGYDNNWVYTDATQRFASYTNLDPGEYAFKVKASNNDGIWNNTPTTIRVVIMQAWWQTLWVKAMAALLLGGSIFTVYRYRLKQAIKMHNIRNRIASDLHDDIGSTLSSISYYSEAIRKQVKDSSPQVLPLLAKMEAASDNSVDAMSDIVWTANPAFDKGIDLLHRMRTYAVDVCDLRNVRLEFETDPAFEKAKLNMETKRNLFLIFKEAVNNALKYSGCTILSVRVGQDAITIQDNGNGFDTSCEFPGNGLKNMKHRAKEIKGQLYLKSSGDLGTQVTLKF